MENGNQKMQMDLPKKKRKPWSEDDDVELMEIWEQHESELRKAKRNSHIYARMGEKTKKKFSAQEVHCKIRNLTSRYRMEKKLVGPSGGSPSTWVHFNRVHRIIGSHAVNSSEQRESFIYDTNLENFDDTIDYSTPSSSATSFVQLPSPTPSSSGTTFVPLPLTSPSDSESSKKIKKNFQKEIYEEMQKQTEQVEKQTKQADMQFGLIQSLSQDFKNFVQRQDENDKAFLEIFKKMAEDK